MESSPILLTCILSTLVATSLSLICMDCYGEDEKSCYGEPKQCPDYADACVATYDLDADGKSEFTHYRRYCGERQNCSLKGSFSSSASTIKISSSCCFTSNCVPSKPVLPSDKTEKNGVSCMDCQGTGDKPCTSSTYRDCTGDEKNCVMLIESAERSVRGCGTLALCNDKGLDIRIGEQEMQFRCSSGAAGMQRSLFTLLAASILLMRLIG